MRYYYSTVPALAWVLNHYFYGGVHYNWLAASFCPMRTNPHSSNPYVIYGQLAAAWSWADHRDKFLAQVRHSLEAGVDAHEARNNLDPALAKRLRRVCANAAVAFFYPVVYRVDMDAIPRARRVVVGSGQDGSSEFLVANLSESEFDLLLADNWEDPDFVRLVLDAYARPTSAFHSVLEALEGRMVR